MSSCFFAFDSGSCHVAQVGLELIIQFRLKSNSSFFLAQLPECWLQGCTTTILRLFFFFVCLLCFLLICKFENHCLGLFTKKSLRLIFLKRRKGDIPCMACCFSIGMTLYKSNFTFRRKNVAAKSVQMPEFYVIDSCWEKEKHFPGMPSFLNVKKKKNPLQSWVSMIPHQAMACLRQSFLRFRNYSLHFQFKVSRHGKYHLNISGRNNIHFFLDKWMNMSQQTRNSTQDYRRKSWVHSQSQGQGK